MTGNEYGTFLRQIQENGGQDVMLEMLRLMVQTVLEEGITQHLGAHPHERSQSRRGHRNGYKPRTLWITGTATYEITGTATYNMANNAATTQLAFHVLSADSSCGRCAEIGNG